MKIKWILAVLSIVFYFSIKGQVPVLFTDFNNGFPTGWQLIDNDGLTPASAVSAFTQAWNVVEDYDSIGTGDSILVATSWFETPGVADDYLISPAVVLGAYGNYLSFDLKSRDASNPDGFEVLFSTGGITVADFTANSAVFHKEAVSPYWTTYTVNLDDYNLQNQNVHLAFRHFANDGFILELDNIRLVINDPVGVHENVQNDFNVYPNPAVESVFVHAKTGSIVSVFDIHGRLITSKQVATDRVNFNLKSGIYLVEVGGRVQKLIVR